MNTISQTMSPGTMVMDTPPVQPRAGAGSEPIPGYVLQERIGAGGFAEVWSAEAPGGLAKAVKIVLGAIDESRAEAELKALERVKGVRHPFLLSIERVEVIDGKLHIVTELADRSLIDRFRECRENGLPGIPRDELLVYLRDAADALDYMYDTHSLQHLDIKPENLLLVGGRVKVADFGLLKDLSDRSMSHLAGLTPMFSPPEVFEGRPGRQSDQYSLAIVYQLLLTGEPPFTGRTAAHLTAQHLHGSPSLIPLPATDRSVVAGALAKNPLRRYANCRDLVDRLLEVSSMAPRSADRDAQPGRTTRQENRTESHVAARSRDAEVEPATRLPAADWKALAQAHRPVVFIGLGGLAGRILAQLKHNIAERLGHDAETPAIQFLHLDTQRYKPQGQPQLTADEFARLPLRSTQDYRGKAESLLEWIDRRWLYNVPRSLKTEGIRPLGRLAFVDDYPRVAERLSASLAAATKPAAIEATSDAVQLPLPPGPPRVFIVASINGGLGSGAVLDASYAVRTALTEQFGRGEVCGILVDAPAERQTGRELATANAIACLEELWHLSRPGAFYPGDPSCGLPKFDKQHAPFAQTYVVQFPEGAAGDEDVAVDGLAEYLLHNVLTSACGLFEALRDPTTSTSKSIGEGCVRSMSLGLIDASADAAERSRVDRVCRELLRGWTTLGQRTTSAELTGRAAEIAHSLELGDEQIDREIQAIAGGGAGRRAMAFCRRLLDRFADQPVDKFLGAFDSDLATEDPSLESVGSPGAALAALKSELQNRVAAVDTAIGSVLEEFVESPGLRIGAASGLLSTLDGRLVALHRRIETEAAKLHDRSAQMRADFSGRRVDTVDEHLLELAMLEFCRSVQQHFLSFVADIRSQLSDRNDELRTLCEKTQLLVELFDAESAKADADAEVCAALDRALQAACFRPGRGLATLLNGQDDRRQSFVKLARVTARALLARLGGASVSRSERDESNSPARVVERIEQQARQLGGGYRVFAALPAACPLELKDELLRSLGEDAIVLEDGDDCAFLCCESQDVPLAAMIERLIDGNPQRRDMASRLHTRVDIQW